MHVATATVVIVALLLVYNEAGAVRVRTDGFTAVPVRRATPSGVMLFLCAWLPTGIALRS